VYIKDLRIFHQWDLRDIILVDNAVYSFAHQLDNGIPIFSYYKGKDDEQLLYLKEYLKSIVDKDVTTELKKTFQMRELYNSNIDFLLDFYENQEDQENSDDILDQIATLSREKRFSFQLTSLAYGKSKGSYDDNSSFSEKYEESSVVQNTNSQEIPRGYNESSAGMTRSSFPSGELKLAAESPTLETKVKAKRKKY